MTNALLRGSIRNLSLEESAIECLTQFLATKEHALIRSENEMSAVDALISLTNANENHRNSGNKVTYSVLPCVLHLLHYSFL